ncbi:MAG: hypothetical protein RL536_454 [Candidatus Parcubacteria bacterium]|jgi:hypothetical protein
MKKIEVVTGELREQVEEATDPRDPRRLPFYTRSICDNIESLVSILSEDPTMAALAFHNQIKFDNRSVLDQMATRKTVSRADWPQVKQAIQMRPEAHVAVKMLEEAGLEDVLVMAVVANFNLKQLGRAQSEAREEEFSNV